MGKAEGLMRIAGTKVESLSKDQHAHGPRSVVLDSVKLNEARFGYFLDPTAQEQEQKQGRGKPFHRQMHEVGFCGNRIPEPRSVSFLSSSESSPSLVMINQSAIRHAKCCFYARLLEVLDRRTMLLGKRN